MTGEETKRKPRVHGIGGVFFKASDPAGLANWYREHLDFDVSRWGGAKFAWKRADTEGEGATVWTPFKHDTEYFAPSEKPFMLNLRVDDLETTLRELREEGCQVLDRGENSPYGNFGYVVDPEGNLLELWQPPADSSPEEKA